MLRQCALFNVYTVEVTLVAMPCSCLNHLYVLCCIVIFTLLMQVRHTYVD